MRTCGKETQQLAIGEVSLPDVIIDEVENGLSISKHCGDDSLKKAFTLRAWLSLAMLLSQQLYSRV